MFSRTAKVKNLKYVYCLTSTNTATHICAKSVQQKTLPPLQILGRTDAGGSDGDANNGLVDVHWPDDAAINALCL